MCDSAMSWNARQLGAVTQTAGGPMGVMRMMPTKSFRSLRSWGETGTSGTRPSKVQWWAVSVEMALSIPPQV